MDEPNYLIINPLRIDLINKRSTKRTEIEDRFYNKMEELKNISLQITYQKKLVVNHIYKN